MNCRITEIRDKDIVLLDEEGMQFSMRTSWFAKFNLDKGRMKEGSWIRIESISYGCCTMFLRYEATFESFNNTIAFCPFCGVKQ